MNALDILIALDNLIFVGWWFVPYYILSVALLWKGASSPEWVCWVSAQHYALFAIPVLTVIHAGVYIGMVPPEQIEAAGIGFPGLGLGVWVALYMLLGTIDGFLKKHFGVGYYSYRVDGKRVPGLDHHPELYASEKRVNRPSPSRTPEIDWAAYAAEEPTDLNMMSGGFSEGFADPAEHIKYR